MHDAIERITQGRPWAELGTIERVQVILQTITISATALFSAAILALLVGALWWFLL